MKECVLHTTPARERTTNASSRIARYLAEKLKAPLYDGEIPKFREHVDRIFYVNSMGAFATPEFREAVKPLVQECSELIYVQNDYTIHPISQTQKIFRARDWAHDFPFNTKYPILWSTVKNYLVKPTDSYVNWNQLTYQPLDLNAIPQRKPAVVYWGSYRQGRAEAFKRYFTTQHYITILLCVSAVYRKFNDHLGVPTRMYQAKPWYAVEDLAQYEATLYIEDEDQHREFHSLANRFYEAMSAGLAIFVDSRAIHAFSAAGMQVADAWIVRTAEDIAAKLPYAREIAHAQRVQWAGEFRTILDKQVDDAYAKL